MTPDEQLRHHRRGGDDSGVVLVTVLLAALVLSLLAATLVVYVTRQMPQAAQHEDRQASLAAAEAGVEDYLQRINADPEYYLRGKVDPANPSFQGFVPVPGAQDGSARYRIDAVDIASVPTRGVVVVEATGQVGGQSRSIRVELARKKFTDYAYMSDLEVNDPRNAAKYPKTHTPGGETIAQVETRCGRYAWNGRQNTAPTSQDDNCGTISWTNGDKVYGKLHTNDTLGADGNAYFDDIAESGCSAPGCGTVSGSRYMNYARGGGSPQFRYPATGNGFGVAAAGIVPFPADNRALKAQAQAPATGCLFTGPTRIVLRGATADVYNRNSRATNGAGCGGNYTTKSGSGYKHSVPMTDAGLVIYVQSVPADPTDPNYTAPASLYSTAPFVPGPRPARAPATYRPSAASAATLPTPDGFPLPEDIGYSALGVYGPSQGDVLIEGTLDGRLTVGAEDDVFITDHLRQQDPTGDVLGLVANNFLWNYHPVSANLGGEQYELCGGSCMQDVVIQASIMSVQHAYGTVYPSAGASQGTIRLHGSLVQKWRNNVGDGAFGTTAHRGYAKDYRYDPQLRFTQPPHFLQPGSLVWGVSRWAER